MDLAQLVRKWRRRPVIAVVLLTWASIAYLYVYVFEPHWRIRETRLSTELETIKVIYFDHQQVSEKPNIGDCPNFAESFVEGGTMEDGSVAYWKEHRAFSLAFPSDLPSPEDEGLVVDGNQFWITGYRYQVLRVNVLTGGRRSTPYPPPRFDVVAWEVQVPFSRIIPGTKSGEDSVVQRNTLAIAHKLANSDATPELFVVPENRFCPIPEEHLGVWDRRIFL